MRIIAGLRLYLFILFSLRPGIDLMAQYEDSVFVRYTSRDGLSNNWVTSITQDDWGYLWIGTESGLNRFDGYAFRPFYQLDKTFPLLSSVIRKVERYGPHRIGIITRQGLQLLDTRNLSLRNYIIPDSTAFSNYRNATMDAQSIEGNKMAVATASGFYVFDATGKLSLQHDVYHQADIGKQRILYARDIIKINETEYIIYLEDNRLGHYDARVNLYREISRFDPKWEIFSLSMNNPSQDHNKFVSLGNNEFIFFNLLADSAGIYNCVTGKKTMFAVPFSAKQEMTWQSKVFRLNENSYAINCGSKGFFIFSLDKGILRVNPKKFLKDYKINAIYIDREKRLWVATSGGLFQQRFSKPFLKKYTYTPFSYDISTAGFWDAYRYSNLLYTGRYSRYNGLTILDTATMKPVKQMNFFKMDDPANEVITLQMYHPDTLWLGTNAGILWLDTKTLHFGRVLKPGQFPGVKEEQVYIAPARKDGYAWFCYVMAGIVGRYHIPTRTFQFFTPETRPSLPFSRVKSIAYDSYGDVWLGGHGLARWNSKKNDFDTLITIYGGMNKFNDDILTLSADGNGSLWLHNAENGLLEYRIRDKKFVAYTMSDGLPSMYIQCFSPVVNNNLWIGSPDHLTRFNTVTKKAYVYDYHDGFPDQIPDGRRIYYDEAGHTFYLFSKDQVTKFSPQTQMSSNKGSLLLQEVAINNKRSLFHPGDTLRFAHNENTLTLKFNIIDFESPNSHQLSWRLNNTETWAPADQQRIVYLNQLPPGKYVLQVRASGKFDQDIIRTIHLVIKPPFWQKTWFLMATFLLLCFLLIFFYNRRIRLIRKKANLDKLLAQTEMKALHAQMNPHFLFNSLNSIREMILNNETKEASHFLSKFAHLMRITLDHSSRAFVSLRQTLDYLHRYMEMEQIRNAYFTCRILADAELDPDATVLPPMLIQPFIENAIWHGVTGEQKNININVDFRKVDTTLVCTVDDNGIGIDRSLKSKAADTRTHTPVGISNVMNRIRLLNEKYGLASSITIEDKSTIPGVTGQGTLVTILLPLQLS